MKKHLDGLRDLLEKPKKIVITCHTKPDGDAIGSSLAVWHLMKNMGHDAQVIVPSLYPAYLHYLPGDEKVHIYNKQNAKVQTFIEEAELIFSLDYNQLRRTDKMLESLEASKADFVLIDHHLEPDEFAKYMYSKPASSSTCEMVYDFIEMLELGSYINKEISDCLYLGLVSDTGRFKFSTSEKTFRTAANLIDQGADYIKANNQIFDSFSENRLRFFGHIFLNRLTVLKDYKSAYIYITKEDIKDYDIKGGDTEGLVNYPLSIADIDVAVLFKEEEDMVKMSLRSKGDFSVNDMARSHFNGGGHKNAAGGRSDVPLEETIQKFLSILPDYKEKLN